MFKKNQWVVINETGKVGKIELVFDDNTYSIEVDGIFIESKYKNTWYFEAFELSPAPKTWRTLEVGDIIVGKDGDKAKVLEIGENTFLRSEYGDDFGDFDNTSVWLTFTEAEKNGWKIEGATVEGAEQEAIALLKKNGYQIIKNK